MNEDEWLRAPTPNTLRSYLDMRVSMFRTRWQSWQSYSSHSFSERKQQLFANACCRRLTPWLPASFIDWLDWLEDGVDQRRAPPHYPRDVLNWDDLNELGVPPNIAQGVWNAMTRVGRTEGAGRLTVSAAVAETIAQSGLHIELETWTLAQLAEGRSHPEIPPSVFEEMLLRRREAELLIHSDILRDIVGNPYRRADLQPAWRTRDVTLIAQRMYDERCFDAMFVLSDALEETGCDTPMILEHCRGNGMHYRGCWLVDAILGHR